MNALLDMIETLAYCIAAAFVLLWLIATVDDEDEDVNRLLPDNAHHPAGSPSDL